MKTSQVNAIWSLNRFLTLCCFLSLTSTSIIAQKAPSIEWQKCFGGSDNEDADANRRGFVLTADGGYVFAQRTHSEDYDVANSGNHGKDDAWIVKINSVGVIEWQKCIGGYGTDDPYCIIRTSDNGYIFCGGTSSNDGDVSGHHPDEGGLNPWDCWVVKIDSIGTIQWSKCYGGSRFEIATSIIQTIDGGYCFTGYTNSIDGDVSGLHYAPPPVPGSVPPWDAWVVKIDAKGNIEWQTCCGGTGEENSRSIIQTSDSGYSIAGRTSSKEEGFGNYGGYDAYIVKLDKVGGIEWQQTYGDSLNDEAYSIVQIPSGGYVFGGTKNKSEGFVSRPHTGEFWIMQLDTLGRKIWQKSYGGSGWGYATYLIKTKDSGYAIIGNSEANDGDIIGNHGALTPDVVIFKLSSTGEKQWQKCFGGTYQDYGFTIEQTPDGGYAFVGSTYSNNGDVSGNHSVFSAHPDLFPIDVWFVKLSPESNSVLDGSSGQTRFLNAFPNPASDQINLQLSLSYTLKQVSFYNLMGQQFYPLYTVENSVATVDIHTLPTGSYMAKMIYQDTHQNTFEYLQKFLHFH